MNNVNLPLKVKVRFGEAFKDGNLLPLLREADFTEYELAGGYIRPGATGWVTKRTFEMLQNSGAVLEVMDQKYEVPPSTREPDPEPEPEEEEEVPEEITLEDLNLTASAYMFAKENGLHPVEILDTLEVMPETLEEVKFGIADVRGLVREE